MNIIEKISEWQRVARDLCCRDDEIAMVDGELDLVIFAITSFIDTAGNPTLVEIGDESVK